MHSVGGEKGRDRVDIAGVAGCVVAANGLLHPLRHICFVAGAQLSAPQSAEVTVPEYPESSACAISAILTCMARSPLRSTLRAVRGGL
jgi:hypothetical protein